MYVINGDITIDKIRFRSVNDLRIKESVLEYKNTCIIKLPTSSVLKVKGVRQTASVQTAKQFKEGQKVNVNLGYNDTVRPEFVGFVARVNYTTPVSIECEGYSYQLRKKKNIKKSWKRTTLKEVLKYLVEGTDIKLHPMIPDMPLVNLVVNDESGTQLLEYLVELLKGALTACFFDDVLYVGLAYQDVVQKTVKYRNGWNVISNSALKAHTADDAEVKIKIVVKQADGTEKPYTAGKDGGVVRKETMTAVKESEWLTKIAETKLAQEKFIGYDGNLECFLIPYCRAGYRAEYTDPVYPEKNMNCFVTGVEIGIGMGGGRRNPQIGIKLS